MPNAPEMVTSFKESMTPEQFIDEAIAQGGSGGLHTLNELQALVFLFSEAEVLCDMEGIDSFIDSYGSAGVLKCAEAFRSVGAGGIADGLRTIGWGLPDCDDDLLEEVNRLITGRVGYDYEAIRRMVAFHMA